MLCEKVACFSVVVLFLSSSACGTSVKTSFAPAKTFNGALRVTTAVPKAGLHAKGADYANYIIYLDRGDIALADINPPQERLPLGAGIDSCEGFPGARSPDQRLLATCLVQSAGPIGKTSYVVRIAHFASGKRLSEFPLEPGESVEGIAWSPDSTAIAYLSRTERQGMGPFEIVSAVSGHPVPYNSFSICVHSLKNNSSLSIPNFIKDLPRSLASLEWLSGGTAP